MGKFKMPTVQQFLDKKTIYGPKKEPVWVYLEREMRENVDKKPYNEKVGAWLRFLKDLKYYLYCEAKRKIKRIKSGVGPAWYFELSTYQRQVLDDLKANIHQDLLEDLPKRTRKSLSDLGITLKIPKNILMKAMIESVEEPGVFIWDLYKAVYKMSPSDLRKYYDMNAKILMSCLVFIDLEECVDMLENLTQKKKPPQPKPKKKSLKNFQPNVRYGEYLQQCYVPFYSNHSSGKKKKLKPASIEYKFRLRTQESYEKLRKDLTFLDKRKERNKKEKEIERICTYNFWEPPSGLRNKDRKKAAFAKKQKMIKQKAKPKHKAHFKNMQYQVGGVSFTGGTPSYILSNVVAIPTGYIPINGGIICFRGEYVTQILGYWKFPKEVKEECDESCNCLELWEDTVMDYLQQSKCNCGHFYDFKNEGKTKDKYFHPPTRQGPLWIDHAKICQMDPYEDFIKESIKEAIMSTQVTATPEPSTPTISASGFKQNDLLAALLADISDTPLLIPHLPQAALLNNLQEWLRKKVKGKITPREHKRYILQSQRKWHELNTLDFKAKAYRIPFALEELEHMNWSHRQLIQTLFTKLLEDFVSRNRLKQVEQTLLWWSTTKYDAYPSKAFLDIFFTYMPGRMKDTFLINPYSSELTPKWGAKTCPL